MRQRLAFWLSLWHGNAQRGGASLGSAMSSSYQVQLFIESESLLTATQQDEARSFFHEVLSAIRRQGPGDSGAGS